MNVTAAEKRRNAKRDELAVDAGDAHCEGGDGLLKADIFQSSVVFTHYDYYPNKHRCSMSPSGFASL
jgi:hypothetical protein